MHCLDMRLKSKRFPGSVRAGLYSFSQAGSKWSIRTGSLWRENVTQAKPSILSFSTVSLMPNQHAGAICHFFPPRLCWELQSSNITRVHSTLRAASRHRKFPFVYLIPHLLFSPKEAENVCFFLLVSQMTDLCQSVFKNVTFYCVII